MANMEHAKDRQRNSRQDRIKIRGSKSLHDASATAQEKQVFPKTASQAVKSDVAPPFEIAKTAS